MRLFVRAMAFAAIALAGAAAQAFEVEVRRDIEYVRRGDRALRLDAYLPVGAARPTPAVLVIHGGGWRSGSKRQLGFQARAFARAGLAAFAIEYRLAPENPWPAQIEDVRAALAWVKERAPEYGVDRDAVGAYGYSAGGHLAALLGTDAGAVRAVVAGGAPCDLERFVSLIYLFGGTRDERPDAYRDASPLAHVSGDEPPMLFYHGRGDLLVPLEQPERMVEALRAAGREAELLVLRGASHMTAPLSPTALSRATEFLRAKLGAPATTGRGEARLY